MNIWCDSSYDEARKIAGIGIIAERNGVFGKPISFWHRCEDNNEGELFAIYISAVKSGGEPCTIYSDSQMAIDYINGTYQPKQPMSEKRLKQHIKMRMLAHKIRKVSDNISFEWTKGHRQVYQKKSLGNNICDLMAKMGRAKYYGK